MKNWCNDVVIKSSGVEFYNQHGYYVIDNVMSHENCDLLQKMANPLSDDDFSVVLNIHRKLTEFDEVIKDKTIVGIIKAVQDSDVVILNTQFLFKRCNTPYGRQSWTPHQDNSYPMCPYGTYIIVHLSLEDSDPDNGGLIFYSDSHKEDILDFADNKSWREAFDEYGISHPGQTVQIPSQYAAKDMCL